MFEINALKLTFKSIYGFTLYFSETNWSKSEQLF